MNIKTIAVILFSFIAFTGFGQEMFDVKKQTANNIKTLKEKITRVIPETTFTRNQEVRLEKVFLKMNKEMKAMVQQATAKGAYAEQVAKLQAQYKPMIESILTTDQKAAFTKINL